MFTRDMNIADFDAELYEAMSKEVVRQEEHIELIASENYCSPRVLEAQGSQLTNKKQNKKQNKPSQTQYKSSLFIKVNLRLIPLFLSVTFLPSTIPERLSYIR
jgi:glycine/serine hydroxymethyltransferase